MKLIASVSCLDNDDNDSGIDAVLLDMTPETAQRLLELHNHCQPMFALSGFYAVELFDYTPDAFCAGGFEENPSPEVGAIPWIPGALLFDEWGRVKTQAVPDDFTIESGAEDYTNGFIMDCCTMLVQKDCVLWKFYRKHTSLKFETADIPWSVIECAVTATRAPQNK